MILVVDLYTKLLSINKARLVIPVSLCFFILLGMSACQNQAPPAVKFSGQTMGTTYHVTLLPLANKTEEQIQAVVDNRLKAINQVMSTYIPDSELSLLNKAEVGRAIAVSDELLFVLVLAQQISDKTNGAFDVTVGPLVNMWGFGPDPEQRQIPSAEALEKAKQTVGYHNLVIDQQHKTVIKKTDLYVDLSSIAKGYGVDAIASLVEEMGSQNYMVEIGGEIRLNGNSPKGKPWLIGVENPTLAQTGVKQAISSNLAAIATSGDYRNYHEIDGVRYSHTIDPSTGKPITHNLASVTVVADTCAEADALATAITVLGPDKGMALVQENDIAAFFLIRNGDIYETQESERFKQFKVKL